MIRSSANAQHAKLIPSGCTIRVGWRYHRYIRILLSLGANGAQAIPPSFTRSCRDTFCLSRRIRGTSGRELQARASIARHVCFVYHESKTVVYRGRKVGRWRRELEDDAAKGSSKPSIATAPLLRLC